MWCYQKPGFEAVLLTELQKQQQCSQFCDTLLRTEGVSVPAHSCILSAISPHISSALSSTPPPPAGQSRLLEFRALSACTLLHMVRLLYSGEMAGKGEKERQEAVSAAAKLGIHGLVEVTTGDCKTGNEGGEGRRVEVGVQTEPLVPEGNEGSGGRWRREVRGGSTFLWKETLSDGERDTWTQTEELQVNSAPPSHPAASLETIDISALQSVGQTDPHILPSQIPYIPISLVYQPDGNQTHQPSSAPVVSLQESTAAGHPSTPPSLLPFPSQATPCAAVPQSWWTGEAAAEDLEDERFEQFQGNIPGYINYFLNPGEEKSSRRGRAQRRPRARGARRAGTGERGAKRAQPRTRGRGRGRGGLTQTVDVQDVGVSKLQKLFLQRSWMKTSRTGQGGGAVGKRLYVKTRELLNPPKRCRSRRGRGKAWDFSQGGDMRGGGAGSTQQFNQDALPVVQAQRSMTETTKSVSFPSPPPVRLYNVHTLPASSPALQPSPSPAALLSPASSYASPAPSLLHTTSLPHPAPPQEPEHFDRLLEEVMIGLNILPNNNSAPHPQAPLPAGSSSYACASSDDTLPQNKQQGQAVGEAGGAEGSSSANSEVPVLQQQGEGELNEMLENFLQSFERHVHSCASRDEAEVRGESFTESDKHKSRRSKTETTKLNLQGTHRPCPVRQITPLQQADEAESPPPARSAEGTAGKVQAPARRRKKKRTNQYLFSLERKRVRKRVSLSNAQPKITHDQGDKQLQQMPVVKLERSGPLPVRVTLQRLQSLDVKDSAQTKNSSSSEKHPHDSLSEKNQKVSWIRRTYPIRSRFKEAHIMDTLPFLQEPLSAEQPRRRRGRPKKNGQLLSLSNGESSPPPIQPLEPCGTDEQLEDDQERHDEELNVQPQDEEEGPTSRGQKRGAESEEETRSDDAAVAKRVCFERIVQPSSETNSDFVSAPETIEMENVTGVGTDPLTNEGDCSQGEEGERVRSEIRLENSLMDEELESSCDKIIGDVEDDRCQTLSQSTLSVSPPSHSTKEFSPRSTGSHEEDKDEDIDVIGGSSPAPDPVIISWTESSENEEEEEDVDIDIVGEKTDYASSALFTAVS